MKKKFWIKLNADIELDIYKRHNAFFKLLRTAPEWERCSSNKCLEFKKNLRRMNLML